jgi:Replication-relaxation
VYFCRALTAPQIAALFFPSSNNGGGGVNARCKHRLRMLWDLRYLFRGEQAQKKSEGRKPLVYFLDVLGAELLSQQVGVDIDWDPEDNDVSDPFLDHLLQTNNVRVSVTNCAYSHGWKLHTWIDDKVLKSGQKDVVMLHGPRGGAKRAAVVPDGYFRLETSDDTYNFFLEVDLRTVTAEATKWGARDWARKVRAYLEYYRSGKYRERYRTADMRVLTVTTGEKRLAHLKRVTERVGGKARFWFTTFDRIRGQDLLTVSLWDVASRDGLHGLV